MAKFLSPDWLEELASVLREAGPLESEARLALGQIVTGAPSGEVSYTLVLGGGEPSEVLPGTTEASVTLVEDYATAVAIASGSPAADALAAGNFKVRGDAGSLLRAQELFATVGPTLATVAAATTY